VWGPLFPLPSVSLIPCIAQPFQPPKKSGPSFGEGPRRVSLGVRCSYAGDVAPPLSRRAGFVCCCISFESRMCVMRVR
jgi:hypothetical protein